MRGRDDETGDFFSPSRSQQRRDALDVLALGEQLVAMSAAQLARLPIPEALLPHIRDSQRISSYIARKRQIAFLAKQMRKLDDEALDAIRDAMSKDGDAAKRETASLHRVEALRDALLGDDGDAAMTELLDAYPHADRQHPDGFRAVHVIPTRISAAFSAPPPASVSAGSGADPMAAKAASSRPA